MKRIHFAIGLLVLAYLSLSAQTADLRANVPFDFQLRGMPMSAGEYLIHYSNGILVVREQNGRHSAQILLTTPISRPDKPATGVLRFNKYGETYFLASIWTPNSRDGRAFPKSSREKELARHFQQNSTADVSLGSK